MNKRANIQLVIAVVIIIILLLVTGILSWDKFFNKKVYLNNVHAEKDRIGLNEQTKVFFDVVNNGETSLNLKLEIQANQTCFSNFIDKDLEVIPPKTTIPTYVYISSIPSYYSSQSDLCLEKIFPVTLVLKDINGKEFSTKTISIGVV